MLPKLLLLSLLFFCIPFAEAQNQPTDIRYTVMGIHALRYYPFKDNADSIIQQVIEKKAENNYTQKKYARFDHYQKTSVDIVANKDFVNNQIQYSETKKDFVYKYIIRPFKPWLSYARPTTKNKNNLALTTLIYEDYKTVYRDHVENRSGSELHASRSTGFFQTIGQQNISYLLDEVFGDINLYQDRNEVMLLSFKSPLAKDAPDVYEYYLMGKKEIEGEMCMEIAFFSKNMQENVFAGYLYLSTDGNYALKKAVFTLNNASNMNFLKEILITHTYRLKEGVRIPDRKEYAVLLGDEIRGSVIVDRIACYTNFDFSEPKTSDIWKNTHEKDYTRKDSSYWVNYRPIPLSPAQTQVDGLVKTAAYSEHFRNIQNVILILLNNHVCIGGVGGDYELGPLTQFISYNDMEGLRLKIGGNTTLKLTDRFLFGGYLAYGTSDERFKYRANLMYSLVPRNKYIWEFPKRLFSFTYVNDLNIPGQDLLTTNRDNVFYSFSHASTNNMSLQKIGLLTFENEMKHQFSYKIGGKYTFDQPKGVVQYMQVQGTDTTIIDHIVTTEINLSLRYSPREKFIQNRDKRVFIRRGDVELNLNHRVGIKGAFGSDYNYQITDFNAYKKLSLPKNTGTLDLHLSAGKVWNQVPFPLLFIPAGNQSYIFQGETYNCMNFYEFTTDRFVAGNMNFMFNWSPIKLFSKKNKIKTTLGTRLIYGPLSDNNNPELHPELFAFNQGVQPLGNTPYVEANIGLANIFKILRVEYVRRLTYLDKDDSSGENKVLKGSLLFTGSFSF